MKQCKKCQVWLFDDTPCRCELFSVSYEGEKETIYGYNHEDVVEKVAERINMDDPVFDEDLFEEPVVVTDKNGVEKSFNCSAVIDVVYNVREYS